MCVVVVVVVVVVGVVVVGRIRGRDLWIGFTASGDGVALRGLLE
jgi:hypothetical protein